MRKDSGFTLIELMVAISVLAILVSVGVPSMLDFVRGNRRAAAVNALVTDVQRARSTAASQGTNVVMCHSTNGTACSGTANPDWSTGWVVFIDDDQDGSPEPTDNNGTLDAGEPVLSASNAREGVTMNGTTTRLSFNPGFRSMSGNGSIEVCVDGSNNDRQVIVSNTGRPRLVQPYNC